MEGNPSGDLPVFGGTATAWEHKEIDLASLTDGGDDTYIQFRFRLSTSDASSGSPGWFLDNITYNNEVLQNTKHEIVPLIFFLSRQRALHGYVSMANRYLTNSPSYTD